jgi:putative transposase
MPRQARFVQVGKLHHVTQRGNYRQNIFFERVVYLKYINENAKKYGMSIYAYCLMDNHIHFIVKPKNREALAKVFRVTHQRYSFYINKRLELYGHRWQSRYYSCVVLGSHVKKAIRYVELNPVRARMVKFAWEYSWSSVRAHMGTDYKIIELSDISDVLDVPSWKKYLMEEESQKELKQLRDSTLQGESI